jgi:hypothetical protein
MCEFQWLGGPAFAEDDIGFGRTFKPFSIFHAEVEIDGRELCAQAGKVVRADIFADQDSQC